MKVKIFIIFLCFFASETIGQNLQEYIDANLVRYYISNPNFEIINQEWLEVHTIKMIVKYDYILKNGKPKEKRIWNYRMYNEKGVLKEESYCSNITLPKKKEKNIADELMYLKQKGIYIEQYKYNSFEQVTSLMRQHTIEDEKKTTRFEYDDKNQLSLKFIYKNGQERIKKSYKHFENGKVSELETSFKMDSIYVKRRIERYNECGHLIYELGSNGEEFYDLEYDNRMDCLLKNKNKLLKVDTAQVTESGKEYILIEYKSEAKEQKYYYNKNKKLAIYLDSVYDREGELLNSKKGVFDDNGQVIEFIWLKRGELDAQGDSIEIISKTKYEYFPNGHLKFIKEYNEKGQLIKLAEYRIIKHNE